MIGFEHLLKAYRTRNTEKVESAARITLLFHFQTHIPGTFNLGWADGNASVVCLEL